MDEGDDLGPADSFFFPEEGELDPKPIAARLVADLEEFQHLRIGEAAILFLMRAETKLINGTKMVLGFMALPNFQGALGPVGRWLLAKACGGVLPDFIMVLDATWWLQATSVQRTALVHHELLHADHARDKDGEPRFTADGSPIWSIRPHDLEEFNDVVRRYGAWKSDVEAFVHALRDGGAI